MALTTITTGPSAVLNGTTNIPATAIDPTTAVLCFQYNMAQFNTAGSLTIEADLSFDGGATWNMIGQVALSDPNFVVPTAKTGSRFAQGWGGMCCAAPGVGNINRMVRATLTSTAPMSTSMQITQSAS